MNLIHSVCLSSCSLCDRVINKGYVSWRDPKTGSWYIDILDRVLEENAHAIDLARMLTMVSFF